MDTTIVKEQCASIEEGLHKEIDNADMVGAVNNPVTTEQRKEEYRFRRGRLTWDYLDRFKYLFEAKEQPTKTDDMEVTDGRYPKALPAEFYEMLPTFLKALPMEHTDNPHLRDAVLLGMWPVVATMMPYLEVKHDNGERTCAIYVFVAGPPTAGKSGVTGSQDILEMINAELLAVREEELRKYNIKRKAYEIKRKTINLALYYTNHLIDHSLYVQSRYGSLRHKEEEPHGQLERNELLAMLDKTFLTSEAKALLERNGDTNPYRTIRAWREGCFIEPVGKAGKVSTYRKLSPTEQNKRLKLSVKAKNKRQRAVNKRGKCK